MRARPSPESHLGVEKLIETLKQYAAKKPHYQPPKVYVNGKRRRLSHATWEAAFGPLPLGHVIHHRNGNPLDNTVENLACIPFGQHSAEHLRAWQQNRTLRFQCSVEGCGQPHHASGFCMAHYDDARRDKKRAYDLARYYHIKRRDSGGG